MGSKLLLKLESSELLNFLIQKMDENLNVNEFFKTTLDLICKSLYLSSCLVIQEKTNSEVKLEQQFHQYFFCNKLNLLDNRITHFTNIYEYYQSLLITNNCFCLDNQNHYLPLKVSILFEQYKLDSVLLLPIIYQKKYLGAILASRTLNFGEKFNQEDIKLLKIIAMQYGIFLNQLKLEETLKQQEIKINNYSRINLPQNEYLSEMNHELRTPMTAIIGFTKMLKQQIYGELNPKQLQYINCIYDSAIYLLELINDLLDISKIEANKEELFIEKISIEEICKSSLSLVQEKAKEEGLSLNLILDSEIDFCYADSRRLKQILVNLLSNAVKFTEKGSVLLKVEKKAKNLEFSVIDTGIGIKKSEQNKLFQPFFQLKTPLHQKHKGTGLGLALSLKLAKLHGGDITVISEEGKGSCFTLYLPPLSLE